MLVLKLASIRSMKKIEINSFVEMENLRDELQENEFIIDLNNCEISERTKVINFFSGLTFLNGSIKKLTKDQFEIIVNNDN